MVRIVIASKLATQGPFHLWKYSTNKLGISKINFFQLINGEIWPILRFKFALCDAFRVQNLISRTSVVFLWTDYPSYHFSFHAEYTFLRGRHLLATTKLQSDLCYRKQELPFIVLLSSFHASVTSRWHSVAYWNF